MYQHEDVSNRQIPAIIKIHCTAVEYKIMGIAAFTILFRMQNSFRLFIVTFHDPREAIIIYIHYACKSFIIITLLVP